jgi:gluconate 5-dehydrogenase/3-oxoacyl-[acyl-carrier protein] reductase
VTVLTPSWGETEFSVAAGLGPMDEAQRGKVMTGEQMGDLVVKICEFPDHLVFPEIMVQPVIQEIVPF